MGHFLRKIYRLMLDTRSGFPVIMGSVISKPETTDIYRVPSSSLQCNTRPLDGEVRVG